MKTYFFLSRKNTNAKGVTPIFCRIANGSDRADFSTGIYINEKDWNARAGMPAKKLVREYNALQKLQAELIPFIFACESSGTTEPGETLKHFREKKNPKKPDIVSVAHEYINNKKFTPKTKAKYLIFTRNLHDHYATTRIEKIDLKSLNNFKDFLLAKKFSTATVNKKMGLLKQILSYAEQKEYIHKSPFYFYQPLKAENKKPVSITAKELLDVENIALDARLDNVRKLFLLQCYTGLSYIDLSKFDNSNIIEVAGRRFYKGSREKTGTDFYFPMTEKITELLLCSSIISNQKYNQYLKELGAKIGTEKRLTTHVGRRTFAQLNINKGLSFEAVAVMMGHSSTRITEKHYSRAGIERLINELSSNRAA